MLREQSWHACVGLRIRSSSERVFLGQRRHRAAEHIANRPIKLHFADRGLAVEHDAGHACHEYSPLGTHRCGCEDAQAIDELVESALIGGQQFVRVGSAEVVAMPASNALRAAASSSWPSRARSERTTTTCGVGLCVAARGGTGAGGESERPGGARRRTRPCTRTVRHSGRPL